MKELTYISDARLTEICCEVLAKVKKAERRVAQDLEKNVLDPVSAVFDAARSGRTLDEWLESEKDRQVQKTLQNAIGSLHQKILGSLDGWEDTKAGGSIDLRSLSKKIIAEVKNKYNTMNSSSAEAVFHKLENHLRYVDIGHTAYVVSIIPKSPDRYDRPWSHSIKHSQLRGDIREIDGPSFYALATGDENALREIYMRIVWLLSVLTDDRQGTLMSDPKTKVLFDRAFGK